MTEADEEHYKNTNECHICKMPILEKKVMDHDHLSGLYRGPAHDYCNINHNLDNWRILTARLFFVLNTQTRLFFKFCGIFSENVVAIESVGYARLINKYNLACISPTRKAVNQNQPK